jgi:2-(1,2-epoxy-1,2-dihydrophenyl)acetyl-CoA isomerase
VFVPNRVGFVRAMEMAMLGEKIAAPQALEWGLINRVYADDEFETEVEALVSRMACGPTRSYAATKRQLNAWMLRGWQDQLELEAQTQREMAASDDFVEGVLSFIQKRDAAFKGS